MKISAKYYVFVLCLFYLIFASYYLVWAWLSIGLICIFVFLIVWRIRSINKSAKKMHIDELSPYANEWLNKYWHFYSQPQTMIISSGLFAIIAIISIIVAVVGAYKGFWWGLLIALILWLVLIYCAYYLNPTLLLDKQIMKQSHQEIINWFISKSKSTQSDKPETQTDISAET